MSGAQQPHSSSAALVTFSGIDGAGKSTQIDHLCETLSEAGKSFRLLRFWDDAATLQRFREEIGHKVFKGDKGVGSPEAPITRRDKNVQSPAMTLIRLAIYFLDALSLRSVVKRAMKSGVEVVIFDRYIYDELANLELGTGWAKAYIRLILLLVPVPAVSIILDADPDKAFLRKPEYPLEFLHKNRNAYLALAKLIGNMTVVPAGAIEELKPLVVAAVLSAKLVEPAT
jgi:thymidylate kinase